VKVFGQKDGEELVKAARYAIELYLSNPHFDRKIIEGSIKEFRQKYGVFVTLEYGPTRVLRGCVGFPEPVTILSNDIVEAALAAAFGDPRFVPVSQSELDDLTVEISILTPAKPLASKGKEREGEVIVGKDGLIVRYGATSGLLLPIVAVEERWDSKRFLEEVCFKAGLQKDYWMRPGVNIYKFETQVFREDTPKGKIIEVKLE
jgi:hypothetical protein